MEEWENNPIPGLSFEKSPNDSSTSVIVRCTRSATADGLVDETEATATAAANIVVCAQSHQAIVLAYGDDGSFRRVTQSSNFNIAIVLKERTEDARAYAVH